MSDKIFQVSEIVRDLQANLEGNPYFQHLLIEGEVSNLRIPYTGHWYFSLKDQHSALDCAFLSYQNRSCPYKIKNGDKVIVRGGINVYTPQGRMQFKVMSLRPSGQGDLLMQLEALKRKLAAEGLFDAAHKKKLPQYPMDIAIVTGNSTAAREDIYRTFRNRWPIAKLTDYYAPVQGKDAPPKIIEALKKADADHHELIILARGGGSIEDLWCFNDEALARCIYSLNTPVVTGVGHEIDTTLVDYVSDHRSVTPTGAVEDSTPDIHEVMLSLDTTQNHLIQMMNARLSSAETEFRRLSESSVFIHPERMIQKQEMQVKLLAARLSHLKSMPDKKRAEFVRLFQRFNSCLNSSSRTLTARIRDDQNQLTASTQKRLQAEEQNLKEQQNSLLEGMNHIREKERQRLANVSSLLDAYSPLKVLARGYSVTTFAGKVVDHVDQVNKGDKVSIRLNDGQLQAEVTDREKKNGREENDL